MFVLALQTEIFDTGYCWIVHLSFLTSHNLLFFRFCKTSKKTTFSVFLSFFLVKLSKCQSLNLNISRTVWPILMILVSFCRILNGLSDEFNLFWRCSSPLSFILNFEVADQSFEVGLGRHVWTVFMVMWITNQNHPNFVKTRFLLVGFYCIVVDCRHSHKQPSIVHILVNCTLHFFSCAPAIFASALAKSKSSFHSSKLTCTLLLNWKIFFTLAPCWIYAHQHYM